MSHEPECPVPDMEKDRPLHPEDAEANCICVPLRKAERRGYDIGMSDGYKHGYNDHARSQVLGAEMYGTPYKETDEMLVMPRATFESITEHVIKWNQHGQGKNP